MTQYTPKQAFSVQTTCNSSNFAQTISNLLAPRGLARPPADLVEPINIKIWEMGLNTSFTERARMQAVFNTTSRAFGQFFEDWDIILTPITALPTPKIGTVEYLTTSDNPSVLDWFNHLWCNFAYTPLTNLCGMPGISMPMAWQENGLPLGIHAQAKQALVGSGRHLVLTANHPSPLSARRPPRPFVGCGHFSAANAWLEQHGRGAVLW
jgi:amidase